tara:strand:+ start:241 stop:870 length:630 start_codon:yes stop_codon:yes gene_type:complete
MPKVPIDYSKGFIYKLCCLDVSVKEIYIGSSTNFKQRKIKHKSDCNKEKTCNRYVYKFIRDNGGWDNWTMIELHKYPCNDKRELEYEEYRVMMELQSQLNSTRPYITEEEIREYKKNYREEHKEEIKIKNQIYREEHKEEFNERSKKYYEDHKEEINIKNQIYHQEHKEIINMKKRERIVCDNCGCIINKTNKSRHIKTDKCINFKKET